MTDGQTGAVLFFLYMWNVEVANLLSAYSFSLTSITLVTRRILAVSVYVFDGAKHPASKQPRHVAVCNAVSRNVSSSLSSTNFDIGKIFSTLRVDNGDSIALTHHVRPEARESVYRMRVNQDQMSARERY